jgi:hypothetical protein
MYVRKKVSKISVVAAAPEVLVAAEERRRLRVELRVGVAAAPEVLVAAEECRRLRVELRVGVAAGPEVLVAAEERRRLRVELRVRVAAAPEVLVMPGRGAWAPGRTRGRERGGCLRRVLRPGAG